MIITKALQEYIKTMYVLSKQKGEIRVTDIAIKMQCTKPSVNKAIRHLAEAGLVHYETYGKIELTEEGIKTARKVLEAYDIIYTFLTELLEINPEKAKEEAEQMKKSMADDTLNKLAKYVQNTLGLQQLQCDYDINNEKCISCTRRVKSSQIELTKE